MTGKEKCYELKKLREEIAKQHGIEGFEFKECDFEGECEGYCPACDMEAIELEKLIKENKNGKIIENTMQNKDKSFELSGEIIHIEETINKEKIDRPVLRGRVIDPEILRERNEKNFEDKKKKPRGIFKLLKNNMTKGIIRSPETNKKIKEEKRKTNIPNDSFGEIRVINPQEKEIFEDKNKKPHGIIELSIEKDEDNK